MKGIKSFCNHLEETCAFALHDSPTKYLYAHMPRKILRKLFVYTLCLQITENISDINNIKAKFG